MILIVVRLSGGFRPPHAFRESGIQRLGIQMASGITRIRSVAASRTRLPQAAANGGLRNARRMRSGRPRSQASRSTQSAARMVASLDRFQLRATELAVK